MCVCVCVCVRVRARVCVCLSAAEIKKVFPFFSSVPLGAQLMGGWSSIMSCSVLMDDELEVAALFDITLLARGPE